MNNQEFLEIDARVFIMPPFYDCPKCNQQSYGVLSIERKSVTRRCRECWYTQNFALPSLEKKVIYLDQLAISEMMKAINPNNKANQSGRVDSFWITLFEKLDSLSKLQLIVCPDSSAHAEESYLSPFKDDLQRMYELLSYGISFYDPWFIKRCQIHEHLTAWLTDNACQFTFDANSIIRGDLHGWRDHLYFSAKLPFNQEWIDDLRNSRNSLADDITQIFSRWQSETHRTFNDWFVEEAQSFGYNILKNSLAQKQRLIEVYEGNREPEMNDILPNPSSQIINEILTLICQHGFSNDYWIKTIEYLNSPSFKNIPFLKISSMMWAAIARKAANGQKKPPSKGMSSDITTISTLLPYCDAMFIDNECRALLSENPIKDKLDSFGETRLFSSKNRNEFIEYLDNIKNEASPEHLELVKSLYGDTIKPFTTLYKVDRSNWTK